MPRHARPVTEFGAAIQAQFLTGIDDVVFDGIEADAAALRDVAVAHTVAHAFDNPPFGGCQKIGVGGASA